MAEGDVLQIVGGHQAFAASAGGAQQLTLLGPYRINFDDAGMAANGAGVTVGDFLPQDAIALWAWDILLTSWSDVGATAELIVDFYSASNGGFQGEALWARDPTNGAYGESGGAVAATAAIKNLDRHPGSPWVQGPQPTHIRAADVKIGVRLFSSDAGVITQGAADIYVIIAEPMP